MTDTTASKAGAAARAMILPLALAQFIASYAATNMNVAISAIATDLGTTVAGLALAWVAAQRGVTAAIAGSRNAKHVHANAASGEAWALE